MTRLIVNRLLLGVLTLLAVSVLIFICTQILPGDVASAVLGQGATPEALIVFRKELGFDVPPHLRYWNWLVAALQGDLGVALTNKRVIVDEIMPRLGNTLFLAGYAALIAIPLAVGLGVFFVSLSKLILLIDFFIFLFINRNKNIKDTLNVAPRSLIALFVACLFMASSYFWTEATDAEAGRALVRHLRLLLVILIFYLIESREQAISLIKWILIVQVITVCLSWLMFLDVYLPFAQTKQAHAQIQAPVAA
jgi:ABC-type dipeptide/oligopeptide/nickel transport system permease component